jgi:hypothetical protein
MRIKYESSETRQKRLNEWHDHFTLLPVKLEDHLVWFETIQRKCNYTYGELHGVQYRDKVVNVKEYINKHHNNPKGLQAMLSLGNTAKVGEIKKAIKSVKKGDIE